MKIESLHIPQYKIFQDFDIDFCDDEGKPLRMVVIVGINGSGKTTLLECIFKDLPDKKTNEGIKRRIRFSPPIQEDYKGFTPQKDNVFLDTTKSVFYFPEKVSTQWENRVEELIIQYIDKLIYEKNERSADVYQKIQVLLAEIFEGFDLQIDFGGLTKEKKIYFTNRIVEGAENKDNAARIPFSSLSSGEKRLLLHAFSLYMADMKDSVILIDEPEASMHPNWQNQLIRVYERFIERNNNQMILATHSPHIVGAVHREQLRILVKEDGKIKALKGHSGSYGWKIDKILLEIFHIKHLRAPEVEKKIDLLYDLLEKNEFECSLFLDTHKELAVDLGANDSDLTLIRLEMARKKKDMLRS